MFRVRAALLLIVAVLLMLALGAGTAWPLLTDANGLVFAQDPTEDPTADPTEAPTELPTEPPPTGLTAVALPDVTVLEDAAPFTVDVAAGFSGGLAPLTYAVASNSNPSLLSATISGDTLTSTLAANAFGLATITIRATDANSATATTTLRVIVTPVNDPPTLTLPFPTLALEQGRTTRVVVPQFAVVTSFGPGEGNQRVLRYDVTVLDGVALFSEAPRILTDGTLNLTPTGVAGTARAEVRLVDDGGTANGGINTSEPRTFEVRIVQPTSRVDVRVTKTDAIDPVFAGSPNSYTIIVENLGPGAAQNITVVDTLPPQVTFTRVSTVPSNTVCQTTPPTVICTFPGALAVGARFTMVIDVRVNAGTSGFAVNTVSAQAVGQVDTNLSNNSFAATTQILTVGGGVPTPTTNPSFFLPPTPIIPPTAGPPTATPIPPPGAQVNGVNGLAVRTGPYIGASRVGVIRPGVVYPVLASNDNVGSRFRWYKIDAGSFQGWANGRFLLVGGNVALIPPETTVFEGLGDAPDVGVRATLKLTTNLYTRPSYNAPLVASPPAGTVFVVVGRTVQGGQSHWLLVRHAGGVAWMAYLPPYMDLSGPRDALPRY